MTTSLAQIVARIEANTEPWSTTGGGYADLSGAMQPPFIFPNAVAQDALKYLYDNDLVIDFDWANWDEGRKFLASDDPSKYNSIDRIFVLKLLSAVAHNDRFHEGAWASLFEQGDAQKLFNYLLTIEKNKF